MSRGTDKRRGFRSALAEMSHDLRIFLKWTGISVLCGLPVGLVGAVFHHLVEEATLFREEHRWIIWLLPAAGVLIAWLYRAAGMETDGGTNTVLSSVRSEKELRFRTAPLIFAGTVLTHLFGGSAGREGAALQLGGSIGAQMGRWLRLDSRDRHIITLCGMSACFAALFGTPLTAAFFAMEVVSVGLMYYTAIVPCLFSALVGAGIAGQLGAVPTSFSVGEIPALSLASGGPGRRDGDTLRRGEHPVLHRHPHDRPSDEKAAAQLPGPGGRRRRAGSRGGIPAGDDGL